MMKMHQDMPEKMGDSMRGKADKRTGAANPSLRMSGPNWPKVPGKTGPNRSAGYAKARVYPRSQGL